MPLPLARTSPLGVWGARSPPSGEVQEGQSPSWPAPRPTSTTPLTSRRALIGAPLLLLARGAAAEVVVPSALAQGGLVVGRAAPGTRLALDGRVVRVAADGAFAFGFGRDHGPEAVLAIQHPDGRAEQRRLAVARRQW